MPGYLVGQKPIYNFIIDPVIGRHPSTAAAHRSWHVRLASQPSFISLHPGETACLPKIFTYFISALADWRLDLLSNAWAKRVPCCALVHWTAERRF